MAEAHERRLLGTSAFLVAAYGAGYLMQLAALPWVVRAVGAESFGIISFANAFIQYLVILTDYGFNLSASREVSIRRHDRAALQDIYASVLALKLGLCAIAALVLLGSILYFPNFRAAAPVLVCSFGLVVGQALHPSWLLQGLERQRIAAVLSVSCKALGLAAVLALVHAPEDFLFVPLAGAGAQLLVALACVAWIWR
jgi:PST family polysaccharide transporter